MEVDTEGAEGDSEVLVEGCQEAVEPQEDGKLIYHLPEWGRENIWSPVEEGRAKPVGKPWVSEEGRW